MAAVAAATAAVEEPLDACSPNECAWSEEEMEQIIFPLIQKVVGGAQYDELQVDRWVDQICADALLQLTAAAKPFKLAITCCLVQRTDADIQACTACRMEEEDGIWTGAWPPRGSEGAAGDVACIVTVSFTSF
eukprot:GHVT01030682.1.p1 GENE.GHVT01030682.1~~GHVT01030682.1.p1  ORF type:complete len:133 (+),score=39.42 GHVT01030682.1:1151-1549(+)